MRRVLAVSVLLVFLLPTFGRASEARFEETKTFKFRPGGKLTIRALDGSISVRTWGRREVRVHYKKTAWGHSRRRAEERLDDLDVRFHEYGDELEIVVDDWRSGRELSFWDLFNPETWRGSNGGAQVKFEITVPEETDLDISADDSDVDVRRLDGEVDIRVDDGDVELQDVGGPEIRVETDAGDVDLYKVDVSDGLVEISTDEGEVQIENARIAELETETDEGDVAVLKSKVERLSVRTDEGQVELDVEPVGRARYRVVTEQGDVILSLPEDGDYDFDLETDTGRIHSEFDVEIEETDRGERVSATVGRGKHRISVYSDDGDIFLERR
ncbi:MAG: DUF4097 domain-containing protein [Calditrichaeota bacterium]|nr:DUF4097 domain-containing protein [Calditrichota bacterium]